MIPAPGWLYFFIAGAYGVAYYLVFSVHRILHGRLPPWAATLVFPSAWVVCEAILDWLSPYGSWISISYTQIDSPSLMQLAAITGVTGISFLVAWTSSVTSLALGLGRGLGERGGVVIGWLSAVAIVFAAGQARLAAPQQPTTTIRAAALLPDDGRRTALVAAMRPLMREPHPSPEALVTIRDLAEALNADLLLRSEREARAGAGLVAWSETAGRVLESDEQSFLRRAGELAARQGIILLVGYGTWSPGADPPFGNMVAAFDAHGALAWKYRKAHPIKGAESALVAAGNGAIPVLETPVGRIGAVICHDLDFPRFIRQAGRQRLDLLVAPSSDWREITPFHARMAIPRAVENGLPLLRPSDGLSVAVDARGVVLAQMNSYASRADTLVAELPLAHRPTLCVRLGFLLPWLAGATLVTLAAGARRDRHAG